MEDDLCVYCQCEGGHMPDCPTKLERRITALEKPRREPAGRQWWCGPRCPGHTQDDEPCDAAAEPTLPEEPSEALSREYLAHCETQRFLTVALAQLRAHGHHTLCEVTIDGSGCSCGLDELFNAVEDAERRAEEEK